MSRCGLSRETATEDGLAENSHSNASMQVYTTHQVNDPGRQRLLGNSQTARQQLVKLYLLTGANHVLPPVCTSLLSPLDMLSRAPTIMDSGHDTC